MDKYTWSENKEDEVWGHEQFDTREECITDAKENYKMDGLETIAIGIVSPFIPYVDAEDVLEQLEIEAYEHCGEAAEDWIDCKKDEIKKLSEILTKCVNDWLVETKQSPNFYGITDIKTIKIN